MPLIAGLHKDTQSLIAEGIQMVWESYKLDLYVQKYAEQILAFQEKVEDLLVVEEQLDLDVKSLETCAYSTSTLADILSKIQRAVDDLSLRQYSNLHIWVTRLDQQVNNVLNLFNFSNKYCCFNVILFVFRLKKVYHQGFKQVFKHGLKH